MLYNAYGYGAVLVDELVGQVVGGLIDEGGRTGHMRQQIPSDERDLLDIHGKSLHGVQQDDHAFLLVALLDAVNAHQGLLVGGIATNTPHSVSGIQNHFSFF